MAAQDLPPVPHQVPIADKSGILTGIWADWFTKAQVRMGGNLAPESKSTSGYQKLPSGLYIQWGVTASIATGTNAAQTFPLAFPTACLQVIAGIKDNSAVATTQTGQWGTGNYTTTGFDLNNRTSQAYVFNWFAVGY